MTSFALYDKEENFIDDFASEWDACQAAKELAKERDEPIGVYEQEPWDEENDPGCLRWTMHPDGKEEPGHTGSRQFA